MVTTFQFVETPEGAEIRFAINGKFELPPPPEGSSIQWDKITQKLNTKPSPTICQCLKKNSTESTNNQDGN